VKKILVVWRTTNNNTWNLLFFEGNFESCSMKLLVFSMGFVLLVSISSTFYVRIFCTIIIFLVTFWLCQKICMKNLYVKRWWNWPLTSFVIVLEVLPFGQQQLCISKMVYQNNNILTGKEFRFLTFFKLNFYWMFVVISGPWQLLLLHCFSTGVPLVSLAKWTTKVCFPLIFTYFCN